MSTSPTNRVFPRYLKRFPPLVALAAVGLTFGAMAVGGALTALLGPIIGIAGAVFVGWLMWERAILIGNGWLRREVAQRLRQFGERVDTGRDRFVGLAHPCYLDDSRRLVETDDDVGFLTVRPDGFTYRGDGLSFDVPASNIDNVRMVRHGDAMAYWKRIEVTLRDGEPFDCLIFDSRNKAAHNACRADNLRLFQELHRLMTLYAEPTGRRLTGRPTVDDSVLVDD